jgi:6-phosphogluconate dehydrogenase
MQIGMVGLGRMGANLVRRLLRAGHEAVVYDRDTAPGQVLATEGAEPAVSLADMVARLPAPRTIWIMLPSGQITETAITEITALLSPGDTIIDGGNTFWMTSAALASCQPRASPIWISAPAAAFGGWSAATV